MVINFNVPIKVLLRVVHALEQLTRDYADVHRAELAAARTPPSTEKARMFYQSDAALFEQEMKEKAKLQEYEIV